MQILANFIKIKFENHVYKKFKVKPNKSKVVGRKKKYNILLKIKSLDQIFILYLHIHLIVLFRCQSYLSLFQAHSEFKLLSNFTMMA